MKRLSLLIAWALCVHLNAQEIDITFSTTESGTVNHSARNSITLAPNYTYNSGTGALTLEIVNPVVNGAVQYNSIIDPESRVINTSYLVGSTNGALDVNDKGGAIYSIPISLPAGINGLTPSLSLVYSSELGYGISGYGWQIGGISAVSRGGKDYYHDGVSRGIELDTTDRFYLDGQRLVNTNTSFYQNYFYVQYQTDNDIFTRVTPKGSTGYFMGADSWFFAETKSGLKYEYGHTSSSKQKMIGADPVVCWYVSKISDLYGNDIIYSYLQDNNTMYPADITYGPNKVMFYYKEKYEKDISYLKGNKLENRLVLDRIEISYNSILVKKYEFKYNRLESLYNYYTVLNEIIEYGTGTGRLNSTVFSYQMPTNVSFNTPTSKSHGYLNYNSILCTGDFNGDGKADFVCLPDATKGATWTGIRVYLSDGNDNFNDSFINSSAISQLKDIRAIDINADGKDDLIYETGTSSISNYYFMTCNGSSFSGPYSISLNRTSSQFSGISGKKRRFIDKLEDDNEVTRTDYNGDGANDICINDNTGNCAIFSLVTSNGNMGSTTMNVKGSIGNSTITGEVITGDFNGDGKDDVWSIESTGTKIYTLINSDLVLMYTSTFPSTNHFFNLGDFNGDGKTDVFLYGNKSGSTEVDWTTWQIQLSTGAGFEQVNIPQKKSNLKNDYVRVTDFDGDGTSDLMVTSPSLSWNGTYFYINKYSGIDFYTHYLSSFPTDKNRFSVADFNGDARAEVICTDAESSWWSGYKINKSPGNTNILLEKVSNGLGSVQKIFYAKLSQAPTNVYTRGSGAVFPVGDYQGAMTIVSSIQSENGKGGYNTVSFFYEGLKQHLQGLGYLCYSKLRTTDVTNAVYNETINGYYSNQYGSIVYYYYPRPLKTFQYSTATNDTLNRTSYSWREIILNSSRKYIFPYVAKDYTINKQTGQCVIDSLVYDNYGNPTIIKKRYSNGPTEISLITYNNTVTSTQWLLGRPIETTIQFSKTGLATITKTGTKIFDPNNNHLKSETWYAGTDNQITHRYEYWPYGVVKKQIDSIRTGTKRINQYNYTTDHTRILSVIDPQNHTTTTSYDIYGRVDTQTDFLGNYIKYTYDELGRQNIIKSSSGSQQTMNLSWETPTSTPKSGRYSLLSSNNDGSQSKQWFDKYGREIRSDVKGFNGTWIYKVSKYNIKNQIDSISEPYYSNASPIWNRMLYDNYGRKTNLYTPSGRNSSWSYSGNTVTEITAGKSFAKSFNSDGTINSETDAGGTINYYYYPDGKIKTIVAPGNIQTKMEYDNAGNQTLLNDPSAGVTTYHFNGFGEITTQTNARDQQTTINYLSDGRIDYKTTVEGTTSFLYNTNKQLTAIGSPGNISRSFSYDTKGRIISITDVIPGSSSFVTSFKYDSKGRDSTVTHPSGIVEKNLYNSNGYLSSILADGVTMWTITGLNAYQQFITGRYGASLNTSYNRDTYGNLNSIITGSIQQYNYDFDDITGNLSMRQNVLKSNIQENFEYDNLNRLDRTYRGSTTLLDMSYDGKGGIITKSDMGTMNYSLPNKPYALSSISPSSGIVTPAMNDSITYTSFESVKYLSEGTYNATFLYGFDDERKKMSVFMGQIMLIHAGIPLKDL